MSEIENRLAGRENLINDRRMSKKHWQSARKSQAPLTPRSTSKKDQCDEDREDEETSLTEASASSVHSAVSNGVYPVSVWSREHILKSNTLSKSRIQTYHPHGLSEHGELTMLGKLRYHFRNGLSDKIGSVKKSTLQLEVDHLGQLVKLDSFVVLGFDVPNCFEWSTNRHGALKLGYDAQKNGIIYAARTNESKSKNNYVKNLIAVTSSNLNEDLELLCLKASAKSLKSIARESIRGREPMNRDNLNLEKLDLLLEPSLINYLKYSTRLKLGAELHRGESIISGDNQYRLSLEPNGRMVLYLDQTRQKYLFLFADVDSFWFYDLGLLVSHRKQSLSSVFPDPISNGLIGEYLSRVAPFKDSVSLKLTDQGTFQISTRMYDFKVVVHFRDDVRSMWNTSEPKAECVCYLEKSSHQDGHSSDDDDDSSSSNSTSENDSD